MEMNERIKELRKNHLKLSQEAFGVHLGVSRDTIGNIELNRLARPDQKLSLIKLMCKEFNVSEDWILNGTEPMFVEPDSFSLDRFARDNEMTDDDLGIVKAYFELAPDLRKTIVEHFRSRLSVAATTEQKVDVPPLAATNAVEEAEAAYIKSRLSTVQKSESSVSNTTRDGGSQRKTINE